MNLLRRIDAARNDQHTVAERTPRGTNELDRVGFGRAVGEEIDAAAAERAGRTCVLGNELRRSA